MAADDHPRTQTDDEFGSPRRAPTWPDGWTVRHVNETGSTNADLVEAALTGAPDRTVLVADHQTAGRGRLDRRWDAPPGANLLVSILRRIERGEPGEVVRRVGVAAAETARALAGVEARLKWPNDVVVGNRKLGGILAQAAGDDGVVVGLGLNVGWAPEDAVRLGGDLGPLDVLAELLARLDAQADDIHPRYVELLDTIGRRVRVEMPRSEIVGTATGVERDGRLVVVDECALTHRVDVGDVIHLRGV